MSYEPNGSYWVLCQDNHTEGLHPPFFVFKSKYVAEQAKEAIEKFLGVPAMAIVQSDDWPREPTR